MKCSLSIEIGFSTLALLLHAMAGGSFECLPRDTIREISEKSRETKRHNHELLDDGTGDARAMMICSTHTHTLDTERTHGR